MITPPQPPQQVTSGPNQRRADWTLKDAISLLRRGYKGTTRSPTTEGDLYPFIMSGPTNTLAPSTTRRRNPLSSLNHPNVQLIRPITRHAPRRVPTPEPRSWTGGPLPPTRTSPPPSPSGPTTRSIRRSTQPADQVRSGQSTANRDLPASLAHARIFELPPSAVVVSYIEEPRTPRTPRTPSRSPRSPEDPDNGTYPLRRSPRTNFADLTSTAPAETTRSSRKTIMIQFPPASRHNASSRHSPLPSHTGMSDDSMAIDEIMHTPTPFKGPLHATAKVVLDNGASRLEMVGGARTG